MSTTDCNELVYMGLWYKMLAIWMNVVANSYSCSNCPMQFSESGDVCRLLLLMLSLLFLYILSAFIKMTVFTEASISAYLKKGNQNLFSALQLVASHCQTYYLYCWNYTCDDDRAWLLAEMSVVVPNFWLKWWPKATTNMKSNRAFQEHLRRTIFSTKKKINLDIFITSLTPLPDGTLHNRLSIRIETNNYSF